MHLLFLSLHLRDSTNKIFRGACILRKENVQYIQERRTYLRGHIIENHFEQCEKGEKGEKKNSISLNESL